ncbi:MAG: Rsd/AlgQ family anti-sigma factor [Gammaproteobacteria bacterium]
MIEDKKETLKERRGQTSELIEHMLDERKQLLALLLQVSSLESDGPHDPTEPDLELLDEFCQMLVDYIASGHFGLYERIIKKKERRKKVAELAVKVYPRIDETTQEALGFNEKYDPNNSVSDLTELPRDLSRLGEQLTNRIELEDRLINLLLGPADTLQI